MSARANLSQPCCSSADMCDMTHVAVVGKIKNSIFASKTLLGKNLIKTGAFHTLFALVFLSWTPDIIYNIPVREISHL